MSLRLERFRQRLVEQELDAFLISQPENRRYLSGFTGSAGLLAITPERALLLVDFRYTEQATQQAPDFEVVQIQGPMAEYLPPIIEQLGGALWGFESAHITVAQYKIILSGFESVGTNLRGVENLTEGIRAIKNAHEVELLCEAVRITDEAFAHFLEWVRPGVTERQVAWEIEKHMREHGAEGISFPTIVASGPNGAMAHHRAGERPLQPGEPVIIDMGAIYEGYCADMTRTICLGQADERFWEIYNLVLQAQEAAEAGIHAGITGVEGDRLARQIIENAGYGEQFGHGLGHAVGLAVHEIPRFSPLAEDVVAAGVTITVEPGIYIPGWGGVRIEDIVLMQEQGCQVLTQTPKDPLVTF